MIDPYLEEKLPQLIDACNRYNVARLFAFGSIVDGRFVKGSSDIDLLVEFDEQLPPKEKSKQLLKLWIQLQAILESKVDLVTNDNIEGAYFKKYLELYKVKIFEKE